MMGETFKYCAPIAGALGFSAEDTAEAIGLMGNAGIKSTQAGTALRTIMSNLSGEVKICGSSIGEVTIATTNADGSMRDLSDILADCRTAFGGLSESEKAAAAEALVGKNAMSGFLALMNAAPADIEKVSSAIANCDGKSAEMAATMQDNLAGQLTILKSQLEELAISFGEILMPAIRQIVTWVQGFVDKLNGIEGVCRVPLVQDWKIHTMAQKVLHAVFDDPEGTLLDAAAVLGCGIAGVEQSEVLRDKEVIEEKLKKEQGRYETLLDMRMNNEIPREVFSRKQQEVGERIAELEQRMAQYGDVEPATEADVSGKLENLQKLMGQSAMPEDGEFSEDEMDRYVSGVRVYEDRFEWLLNLSPDAGGGLDDAGSPVYFFTL